MFTPYDWQEGIGHRAQYVEAKLSQGSPVLAVSLEPGILIFTYRRQARKIFEIYDRLVMAGIGQQADVDAVRMAALEFASKEGFNRSEEDVNVQRVATAMSAPMKKAFGDFSSSPIVARSLFCEVGPTVADDLYYMLDYDGDYSTARRRAMIAGIDKVSDEAMDKLSAVNGADVDAAMKELADIWQASFDAEGDRGGEDPSEGLTQEAVLLERSDLRENRFRLLTPDEL